MNVLHVSSTLVGASGPTTFCVRTVEHLVLLGVNVKLFVESDVPDIALPHAFPAHLVTFGPRLAPSFRPDVVHVHALWIKTSHHALAYADKNGIPCVLSTHGMLAPWALKHKWLKKKIAWLLYQKRDLEKVSMFHVTAESEVTWLRDLGFKQPCVLAPLGSDLPDLNNAETQRRRDVKTVLFVGRVYPVKGLMNLVKAWALVRSSKVRECESALVERPEVGGQRTEAGKDASSFIPHPSSFSNWQLVIAGPDQAGHKAELVAEAERLGLTVADVATNELMNYRTHALPPDIVFTGPVYGEEKDALYRMADLFVLPSFSENFGVVVTDALSYRVPVITTKGTPWAELLGNERNVNGKPLTVCDNPLSPDHNGETRPFTVNRSRFTDFSANGRCGWWIDIGVEPLAEALKEAMSLSDRDRHMLGVNGRRLVETKYTWPAIATTMKRAYESLTECKETRRG